MAQKLLKYVDEKGRSYPNLYRDEVTNIFYVRDRDLGKISLETDVAKTAIPKIYTALEELKRRKDKATVKDKQNILFKDLYEILKIKKNTDGIKPQTLLRVDTIWKKSLEPFWGNVKPSEATQEKVDEFKAWHKATRKNPRTGKEVQFINVFKYLGNLFGLAVEYGYMPYDKVPKLVLPKPEQNHHAAKKGRVINHDEFDSIKKNLVGQFELISRIAYYMGMRKMEIGALEVSRVLKEKGKLYVDLSEHDTKTGIPRTIPVPDFLADDLRQYMAGKTKYVFTAIYDNEKHIAAQMIDRAWREAKEAAGIQGRMRFHDLRHTAATNMARAEVNPIIAVTYLGMSLKTYQKRYLKLTKEDLLIVSENADKLFKKPGVAA